MRYSIVLPVFNEAENICAFGRRAKVELPPEFELLVCYDHDTDTTLPALAAVQHHRVYAIASDVLLVPGPRVAEGARQLFALLHP